MNFTQRGTTAQETPGPAEMHVYKGHFKKGNLCPQLLAN
jgi:hypothetical protein